MTLSLRGTRRLRDVYHKNIFEREGGHLWRHALSLFFFSFFLSLFSSRDRNVACVYICWIAARDRVVEESRPWHENAFSCTYVRTDEYFIGRAMELANDGQWYRAAMVGQGSRLARLGAHFLRSHQSGGIDRLEKPFENEKFSLEKYGIWF